MPDRSVFLTLSPVFVNIRAMNEDYQRIQDSMREYYESRATLSVDARLRTLRQLKQLIRSWEERLNEAIWLDLNKSRFENYETEIGLTQAEISHLIRHLRKWAKPERVSTPLAHFPSRSLILKQPKGVVMVMSPWNYPIQLALVPLACALAAGCCVLLKPSRYSENVSRTLKEMFSSGFDPGLVSVVEGGHQANTELLQLHWDHIFFTGSPNVGRIVMEAAAKNLTPVTLELGGKSPCIIDGSVDMKLAATRLAWGKFLNAGQTCVAPDYLLIDRKYVQSFKTEFRKAAERMYPGLLEAKDLGKIINRKHFDRLMGLLEGQKTVFGGEGDAEALKIAPTLLEDVDPESPVMKEEIFGPVLPMIAYDSFEEAVSFIRKRPKPLALYIFSRNREHIRTVQERLTYGGGCVNDVVVHLSNPSMPFGGVGESGMGSYHARQGFNTFTHEKSILSKGLWLDLPVRYAPYDNRLVRLLRLLMK